MTFAVLGCSSEIALLLLFRMTSVCARCGKENARMRRNGKHRKYESKEKEGRFHKKNGELLLTPRRDCIFTFTPVSGS